MKTDDLTQQLNQRIASFFPELAGCAYELQKPRRTRRRFSHTLQYAVRSGEVHRELFVKIPTASGQHQHVSGDDVGKIADRPRLVPVIPVSDEVRWEHESLSRMGEHFAKSGQPYLGCPRVLDLISHCAIVTEGIAAPTVLQQLTDRRVNASAKEHTLRQAGRWLRTFHQMPAHPSSSRRLVSHQELAKSLSRFIAYLSSWSSQKANLKRIGQTLQTQLHHVVPTPLEAVCGHGDFGPHNLLVDGERIVGLDTLANWQTSRFEDLAYFLLLIETTQPMFRQRKFGNVSLQKARRSFLQGYFGSESIPLQTLAWFEALVALDKWASVIHSTRKASGMRHVIKRMRMALQQMWLQNRIEQVCERLRDDESGLAFDPAVLDRTAFDSTAFDSTVPGTRDAS